MVTVSRPETVEQYLDWASATLGIDFRGPATRNRYETNIQNAQNAIQNSTFTREFPAFIAKQEQTYQQETGGGLLMASELTVIRKPFDSAVTKSFRVNVLRNKDFPNPPRAGWISPDSWYANFDDLVRATLVCKFFDGPKILAHALDAYASSMGLTARHIPRNTEDGYYAFHHYTGFHVDIVDAAWQTEVVTVQFEIQLTTQLQEVLRQLTHPLYESARVATGRRDEKWKWELETPRFKTSYLGHTLHLIEAMILQVRDSSKVLAEDAPDAEVTEPPPARPQIENSSDVENKE